LLAELVSVIGESAVPAPRLPGADTRGPPMLR